jgi:hypothetical protein
MESLEDGVTFHGRDVLLALHGLDRRLSRDSEHCAMAKEVLRLKPWLNEAPAITNAKGKISLR